MKTVLAISLPLAAAMLAVMFSFQRLNAKPSDNNVKRLKTGTTVRNAGKIDLAFSDAKVGGIQNEFTGAISKALPAVVLITAEKRVGIVSFDGWGDPRRLDYYDMPSGQGSGFFIHPDGFILTNNHVVEGQDKFWITLNDGREFSASVTGSDPASDLAVLKINSDGVMKFPFLRFADPANIAAGQWALAIGAPFSLNRTVTVGIVSNVNRGGLGMNPHENYVQTDASVNPGNSGGPLLNTAGDVIGVNDFIVSPSGGNIGLSFAVSSGLASKIAGQLVNKGFVERPWLGVTFAQPFRSGVRRHQANNMPKGVVVERVFRNSPAASKLMPGDLITSVDGVKITAGHELRNAIFNASPGAVLKLELIRDGSPKKTSVTLAPAPRGFSGIDSPRARR